MTSHSVAQLLGSLGVTKSHSRPHVSNDNPFSESQFKTMKYRPEFPKRFGGYEDASQFCRQFFDWYNNEHYHSGFGMLTPSSLHYGQAAEINTARDQTLQRAWQNNPERFVGGIPKPASLPKAVWINAPKRENEIKNEAPEANCPGAPEETSLTHPRSGYPLVGCVSAEPTSVSPDNSTIGDQNTLNTRVMPRKMSGFQGLAPDHTELAHSFQIKVVSKSLTHSAVAARCSQSGPNLRKDRAEGIEPSCVRAMQPPAGFRRRMDERPPL